MEYRTNAKESAHLIKVWSNSILDDRFMNPYLKQILFMKTFHSELSFNEILKQTSSPRINQLLNEAEICGEIIGLRHIDECKSKVDMEWDLGNIEGYRFEQQIDGYWGWGWNDENIVKRFEKIVSTHPECTPIILQKPDLSYFFHQTKSKKFLGLLVTAWYWGQYVSLAERI